MNKKYRKNHKNSANKENTSEGNCFKSVLQELENGNNPVLSARKANSSGIKADRKGLSCTECSPVHNWW